MRTAAELSLISLFLFLSFTLTLSSASISRCARVLSTVREQEEGREYPKRDEGKGGGGVQGTGWGSGEAVGLKAKVSNFGLTFRDRYSTQLNPPRLSPTPHLSLLLLPPFYSLSNPPPTTQSLLSFLSALSTHFCSRILPHRPHCRVFLKEKDNGGGGGGGGESENCRKPRMWWRWLEGGGVNSLLKQLPLKVLLFFKKGSEMKREKWKGEIGSACFESSR